MTTHRSNWSIAGAILATFFAVAAYAQAPTIATDKPDYAPGEVVTITGTGWQPGETVTIVLHEDPFTHEDRTLFATADGSGSFTNSDYSPQEHDIGVSFTAAAIGQASGWTAETTFTDFGPPQNPAPQSLPYLQDFSSLPHSAGCPDNVGLTCPDESWPPGWEGWRVVIGPTPSAFAIVGPTTDMNLLEFGEAGDFGQGVYNYNGKIGFVPTGAFDPALVLAIDTRGQCNATITFDIMTVRNPYDPTMACPPALNDFRSNRINQLDLQYRVGTAGSFASVSGIPNGIYETPPGPEKITPGDTSPQNPQTVTLTLPTAAMGWPNVQIRWVQRQVSGCGGRPSVAVDNVSVSPLNVAVGPTGPVSGPGSLCPGAVNVGYAIAAVGGATSYTWTVPAGASIATGQGTTSITVNWGSSDGSISVVPSSACATGAAGGLAVSVNPAPEAAIAAPASGSIYAVDTPVTFEGTFTDNSGDTHTATWLLDGTSVAGTVNEGAQMVSATHTFTAAGVYMVQLTVADQCGSSSTATQVGGTDAMVVVYDPDAGFVTGGGWINSPAGAYYPNPLLMGRANFGFVSKYRRGASTPTGETEFQYQVGNLNFHSSDYDWLVVSGARAQYKGSGTINSTGNYGFLLTAIDGAVAGGADRFRMKIWDKSTNSAVYDNQLAAPDGSDPTTVIGGGAIVIHTSGGAVPAGAVSGGDEGSRDVPATAALPLAYGLSQNQPNPFGPRTRITFGLPEWSRVTVSVYDVLGREVKVLAEGEWEAGHHAVTWAGENSLGGTARAGVYLVRMNALSLTSDRSFRATRRISLVR